MKALNLLEKLSGFSGFELRTGAQLLASLEQRSGRPPLAAVPPFDRLKAGGLVRGSSVEICGPRSSGRFALALSALAAATRTGETVALVDAGDHLDPRAARDVGVDLRRLLWVRPRRLKDAVLCAEMTLNTGFGLVALDLGTGPLPPQALSEVVWQRLARAAETQNGVFLLVSPSPIRPVAAHAIMETKAAEPVWLGEGDAPRLLSGLSVRVSVHERMAPPRPEREPLALSLRAGWSR